MARSSKADKARQLNAAYDMLAGDVPPSEAMQRLSQEFALRNAKRTGIWKKQSS